ncbi:MAG: transporter [Bilophila sp.]
MNATYRTFFLVMGGLLLLTSTALAEEQTPTPHVGSPMVISNAGPAGGTLPAGVLALMLNYTHSNKDGWYDNGSRHTATSPLSRATQRNMQDVYVAKLRYGLGNNWDIRSATAFVHNDFKGEATLAPATSKKGVSDTLLVAHKQFMSQSEGAPLDLAFGLGGQIPTGSTDADAVGTGAWGLLGELGATYAFDNGRQVVEAELIYLWRGKGGKKSLDTYVDANDFLRFNSRYVFALNEYWDLGVESQYEYITASRLRGHSQHNASHAWFAGPAVTLKIPDWQATLGLTAQFSLYQDYDSKTPLGGRDYPNAASLGERFRLEATLTKAF